MRYTLVGPDNSVLRNAIGIILFIPVTLVAMAIALPFALFGRPSKKTAVEVAAYLSDFIQGNGGDYDWGDLICVKIANPELDSIRVRASLVELPVTDEGLAVLRSLLCEVESLVERDNL